MNRTAAARNVAAFAFALATAGLLVLAWARRVLFDRWALTALAIVALIALVTIVLKQWAYSWLAVGAVWVYATVMAVWRAKTSTDENAGLGLIFAALAFGALAAYVARTREML